mmetsp:Transcript_19301/g.59951  ORF Transcript_19301/g.59951 Transcript_19301/m.59951 type:complete len:288 (+) Transcript_19301:507-1370(+)
MTLSASSVTLVAFKNRCRRLAQLRAIAAMPGSHTRGPVTRKYLSFEQPCATSNSERSVTSIRKSSIRRHRSSGQPLAIALTPMSVTRVTESCKCRNSGQKFATALTPSSVTAAPCATSRRRFRQEAATAAIPTSEIGSDVTSTCNSRQHRAMANSESFVILLCVFEMSSQRSPRQCRAAASMPSSVTRPCVDDTSNRCSCGHTAVKAWTCSSVTPPQPANEAWHKWRHAAKRVMPKQTTGVGSVVARSKMKLTDCSEVLPSVTANSSVLRSSGPEQSMTSAVGLGMH